MIEFLLIFGETNFMKVPKSTKSAKFVALEKKVPYGTGLQFLVRILSLAFKMGWFEFYILMLAIYLAPVFYNTSLFTVW